MFLNIQDLDFTCAVASHANHLAHVFSIYPSGFDKVFVREWQWKNILWIKQRHEIVSLRSIGPELLVEVLGARFNRGPNWSKWDTGTWMPVLQSQANQNTDCLVYKRRLLLQNYTGMFHFKYRSFRMNQICKTNECHRSFELCHCTYDMVTFRLGHFHGTFTYHIQKVWLCRCNHYCHFSNLLEKNWYSEASPPHRHFPRFPPSTRLVGLVVFVHLLNALGHASLPRINSETWDKKPSKSRRHTRKEGDGVCLLKFVCVFCFVFTLPDDWCKRMRDPYHKTNKQSAWISWFNLYS